MHPGPFTVLNTVHISRRITWYGNLITSWVKRNATLRSRVLGCYLVPASIFSPCTLLILRSKKLLRMVRFSLQRWQTALGEVTPAQSAPWCPLPSHSSPSFQDGPFHSGKMLWQWQIRAWIWVRKLVQSLLCSLPTGDPWQSVRSLCASDSSSMKWRQ